MPSPTAREDTTSADEEISLQEFLEGVSPGTRKKISGFATTMSSGPSFSGHVPAERVEFIRIPINLFCNDPACARVQFFANTDPNPIALPAIALFGSDIFLHYRCRNCLRVGKTYAVHVISRRDNDGTLVKIGEWPSFGPPLPSRLQRLVQSERDLLLKGFQSEKRGFGIGAFAYYRRIVEDEKNSLIDQIIRACKKIVGGDRFIPGLEAAKNRIRFTSAIEQIADAIPDALMMAGHNPLTVLHQALSKKIHSETDEACLDAAQAIRTILGEFLHRLAEINRDEAEVTDAVQRLMNASREPPGIES